MCVCCLVFAQLQVELACKKQEAKKQKEAAAAIAAAAGGGGGGGGRGGGGASKAAAKTLALLKQPNGTLSCWQKKMKSLGFAFSFFHSRARPGLEGAAILVFFVSLIFCSMILS